MMLIVSKEDIEICALYNFSKENIEEIEVLYEL
jgi:hypothetical protein